MGRAQRVKGRTWEQQVAKMLRAIFGEDVKRGWQSRYGHDDADVVCPLLWVECKCGQRPNLTKALLQADTASKGRKMPVAICKQDHERPTATMYLDDWLQLVRAWWSLGREMEVPHAEG